MQLLALRHHNRSLLILCLLTAVLFVLGSIIGGCGTPSAESQSSTPPPPRASVPTTGPTGSGGAAQDGGLKRANQAGNVTIEITWEKAAFPSPGGPLRFAVVMDTHSVDLDSIDLSRQSVLRTESGKEVSPEDWDAAKGGHHRTGTLVFPGTVDGGPLVGPQTRSIELIVRGVAGIKERSFKWETGS